MKKTIVILATLLTGLAFHNTVSAGFLSGNWIKVENYRCRLTYIRLNLTTGEETSKKHTSEFRDNSGCSEGANQIAKKVERWLGKHHHNMIMMNDTTKLECKADNEIMIFGDGWTSYEDCDVKYHLKMVDHMTERFPRQVGE